jgi:hypothetical protein
MRFSIRRVSARQADQFPYDQYEMAVPLEVMYDCYSVRRPPGGAAPLLVGPRAARQRPRSACRAQRPHSSFRRSTAFVAAFTLVLMMMTCGGRRL